MSSDGGILTTVFAGPTWKVKASSRNNLNGAGRQSSVAFDPVCKGFNLRFDVPHAGLLRHAGSGHVVEFTEKLHSQR